MTAVKTTIETITDIINHTTSLAGGVSALAAKDLNDPIKGAKFASDIVGFVDTLSWGQLKGVGHFGTALSLPEK